MTTGHTVNALANTFKQAGANWVEVWVIARTSRFAIIALGLYKEPCLYVCSSTYLRLVCFFSQLAHADDEDLSPMMQGFDDIPPPQITIADPWEPLNRAILNSMIGWTLML